MLVDESCVDEGLEEEVEADEHIEKKVEVQKKFDTLIDRIVAVKCSSKKNHDVHWTYVGRSEEDFHMGGGGAFDGGTLGF